LTFKGTRNDLRASYTYREVRQDLEPTETLKSWMVDYDKKLLRLAYAYTRNWATAQDIVQNAFVKAYQSRANLRDKNNPLPWLSRIVINECASTQRRTWREISSSSIPEIARVRSAEDMVMKNDDSRRVHDSILMLPEKLRVPIILFYFNELSVHDISSIIGVREGTVKSRLSRARKQLEAILEGDDAGANRTKHQKRNESF